MNQLELPLSSKRKPVASTQKLVGDYRSQKVPAQAASCNLYIPSLMKKKIIDINR